MVEKASLKSHHDSERFMSTLVVFCVFLGKTNSPVISGNSWRLLRPKGGPLSQALRRSGEVRGSRRRDAPVKSVNILLHDYARLRPTDLARTLEVRTSKGLLVGGRLLATLGSPFKSESLEFGRFQSSVLLVS